MDTNPIRTVVFCLKKKQTPVQHISTVYNPEKHALEGKKKKKGPDSAFKNCILMFILEGNLSIII